MTRWLGTGVEVEGKWYESVGWYRLRSRGAVELELLVRNDERVLAGAARFYIDRRVGPTSPRLCAVRV